MAKNNTYEIHCKECHVRVSVKVGTYELTCPRCGCQIVLPKPLEIPSDLPFEEVFSVAEAAERDGDSLKAWSYFHRAVDLQPNSASAWLGEARTLIARSVFDDYYFVDAINCLERVFPSMPTKDQIEEVVNCVCRECPRVLKEIEDNLSTWTFDEVGLKLEEYYMQERNVGFFLEKVMQCLDFNMLQQAKLQKHPDRFPKVDLEHQPSQEDLKKWEKMLGEILLKHTIEFSQFVRASGDEQMLVVSRDYCQLRFYRALSAIKAVDPDFTCDYDVAPPEKFHWANGCGLGCIIILIFIVLLVWAFWGR